MSTSPEQFTGTPLVAGEVFGVRAWDVDSLGRIKSPQYQHIWTPGENKSECQKSENTFPSPDEVTVDGLPEGAIVTDVVVKTNLDYYMPTLQTFRSGGGIIRSAPYRYKVEYETPGGFRATVEVDRVQINRKPSDTRAHDFTSCSCGFYAYLNGTNDYADHHIIGVVQGYGETFLGTRGFRSSKAKIVAAYASTHADVERVRPLPVSRDRMAELYPDVAWFDDYAAMVAEFPPSDPEPTPETDPEFWTRSA